jgi:SAM-dependent methyltransferase
MTGLDRSEYLIGQAQLEAERASTSVEWVLGDMRSLPWAAQFDACINMFTAFGYFADEDDNQKVLDEICRALKPGGMVLIDLSNRDFDLLNLWPKAWRRDGERIILEEAEFDPLTCRLILTFTRLHGGRSESIRHSIRQYTAPEISAMLRQAGLEPLEYYGDFDGTPFHLRSKRMIIISHKRAA